MSPEKSRISVRRMGLNDVPAVVEMHHRVFPVMSARAMEIRLLGRVH